MARIITIANKKGGIGKTTTALALAQAWRQQGKRVLFVDADSQRNSSRVYGLVNPVGKTLGEVFYHNKSIKDCISHTDLGDIVCADQALSEADALIQPSPKMYKYLHNTIDDVYDLYDCIIFDTPPQAGIVVGNILFTTNDVIIPCTCDLFGIEGLQDFKEYIDLFDDNENLRTLGILIVKYKKNQNLTKTCYESLLPEYAKSLNTRIFNTKIRECVKCQEAQALKESLFNYAPACTTAQDYMELVKEIDDIYKKEVNRYG